GLALCLRAQGKLEGVESLIIEVLAEPTRAVEQDPKDAGAWVRRGLAIADWELWERAAADCDRAFQLRDGAAPATLRELAGFYERWGLIEWRYGRLDRTELGFRRAAEVLGGLEPADPALRGRVGGLRDRLGQVLDAAGHHEEAA